MPLVWPNDWLSQNHEVLALKNRIELVDRATAPATFIDDDEPVDDDDLAIAWSIKKGTGTGAPQNSKTHWFNPVTGRIENIFVKLADVSPLAQPLVGRQSLPSPIQIIDSMFVTQTTGVQASKTILTPTAYESIHIIGQLRSNTAAASTSLLLRYNGSAAASYKSLIHRIITATIFDRVLVNDSTSALGTACLVPAAAGNTPQNVYVSFHLDFYFPSRKICCFGMWSAYVDDGGAIEQSVNTFGSSANSFGALSQITFAPAAGSFDLGSWIIAYGATPA